LLLCDFFTIFNPGRKPMASFKFYIKNIGEEEKKKNEIKYPKNLK